MTQASEDNGSPTAAGGISSSFPHLAGLSHIAYCTGPFQLASLLASLEVCGIPPGQCTVLPFQGSAKNDDLKKTLVEACSRFGMETFDPALMPSPTLSDARRQYDPANTRNRVVHWYCKGVPYCRNALHHLRKTLPDIVFEYYDGFRTPVVAREQAKSNHSLSHASDIGGLRQLAVQRLLQADRYLVPADGLWPKYAPAEVTRKTQYLPLRAVQDKISLVGQTLDSIDGQRPSEEEAPAIIVLASRFSDTRRAVIREDDLRLHEHLLEAIRSASRSVSVLVKTHPRTSYEIMRGLRQICAVHDAKLHTRQQLVEYILDQSGRHDVAVIGPPSTALLSTLQFGYGRAFCLSQQLMASYLGPEYADDHWMTMDHELMETAGVNMVNSLQELRDLLAQSTVS